MKFQVQRRLPGAQGSNDCWQDMRFVEAVNASEAVLAVAHDYPLLANGSEWRAAPDPRWETCRPRSETQHTTTVSL